MARSLTGAAEAIRPPPKRPRPSGGRAGAVADEAGVGRPTIGYSRLVQSHGGKLSGAAWCAAAAAIAWAGGTLLSPGRAFAARPCAGGAAGFTCTTLTVPLERSGAVPGTVTLHVARLLSGPAPSRSAVVALAGGPGQAALPLAGLLEQTIGPALGGRDLVVFDQRGTGQSGPLRCPSIERPVGPGLAAAQTALARCALGLGPARGAYTSAESVADIESIREALGYEHLVLYGTSYGTKVAELYAAEHPEHLEALVLDSVVPPNGPQPFELPTFQALTPVLHELCSRGACGQITRSPVADLAMLTRRLHRRRLLGPVYDGFGVRHTIPLDESSVLEILLAGDLNPALRALLPAAVTAALRGDAAPLAQLDALSRGLVPTVPAPRHPERGEEGENEALYWTTTCEEDPFPWQRLAPTATRRAELQSALSALSSSDFFPFSPSAGLEVGPVEGCLAWPDASPPPPANLPFPSVPTLILSGGQDLRTPTAQARQVAAAIPGAQLVVVPYTGHSVLTSDLSGCAEAAVQQFFAGLPVGGCGATKDVFAPTPIPPASLSRVHPTPGLSGRAGRTVTAALDTIVDLDRIVIAATLEAERKLPTGSRFGGLRGGYAELDGSAVRLVRFSFVSGVELSGTLPISNGQLAGRPLHVGGRAAARGTIEIGTGGRVKGTLGGTRFNVRITTGVLSSAAARAGAGWPSRPLDMRPPSPRTGLRHIP
jgi:pimeloyl-ACP methyl ester carboxylesterase